MNIELVNKLCLGTVQFGLDYGIANRRGKIPKEEIFEILEYARKVGIDILDTAYSYGESERVIGEFIENNKSNFKIISKLPTLDGNTHEWIEKIIFDSLSKLKIKSIYGYLVHKFEDFLRNYTLWDVLESLKERKIIKKIGFSIYKTNELEMIFNRNISFDILQIPYSIFDRRFENFFPILKEKSIKIYVRSVFLQGLAFLKLDDLHDSLPKAKDYIKTLQNLSMEKEIPINALCLNFALLNTYIDKIVIGVDSLEHLKQNIEDLDFIEKVKEIYNDLDFLRIKDEDIILPYKWNLV
jgi:aryl-alcohol dehydrogenase-like predicted oxidoreductase